MSKTLIITGANGFLGQHTIQRAILEHWRVKAIIRSEIAADIVHKLGAEPFIVKDFTEETLPPIIRDAQAVIHFIGITTGQESLFQQINVGSVRNLLNVCIRAQIPRVIIPSGLGVNQIGHKFWADNYYFRSKSAIEHLCQMSTQAYILFRPSFILGPGDELIPWLIPQILNGKVTVVGSGNYPMQPIFVNDAARAFINAAEGMGPDRMIYDLVGPTTINFLELVQTLRNLLEIRKIDLPGLQYNFVSPINAVKKLGMNPEDVDVMQCDVLGNNSLLLTYLGLKLTPLQVAVQAAIDAFLNS